MRISSKRRRRRSLGRLKKERRGGKRAESGWVQKHDDSRVAEALRDVEQAIFGVRKDGWER
jgi:hypothetical protein